MKSSMRAYHGKEKVKREYVNRVRAHRDADELIQGYSYWSDGKGCAVGCTVHSHDYGEYERELGIPRTVDRLEDGIFEGLPAAEARLWPERFLEAIAPGADLQQVVDRFLHWLLVDEKDGVIRFAKTDRQRKVITRVGDLYAQRIAGNNPAPECWYAATYGFSADAAEAAAEAAAYGFAADAAEAAAEAATYGSHFAAGDNADAANTAAEAAYAAAADAAEAAAEAATYGSHFAAGEQM